MLGVPSDFLRLPRAALLGTWRAVSFRFWHLPGPHTLPLGTLLPPPERVHPQRPQKAVSWAEHRSTQGRAAGPLPCG